MNTGMEQKLLRREGIMALICVAAMAAAALFTARTITEPEKLS